MKALMKTIFNMKAMIKGLSVILMMSCTLVEASTGSGRVADVIVGLGGNQVYLELVDGSIGSFPCGSPHPQGFRYVFRTDVPGGKEMLATVLMAKGAGLRVQVVGKGTCAIHNMVEDTDYLWLLE
jgi:hypothetical protein